MFLKHVAQQHDFTPQPQFMFSPRRLFHCHSDGCGSGSTEVARSHSAAEDAALTHLIVCVFVGGERVCLVLTIWPPSVSGIGLKVRSSWLTGQIGSQSGPQTGTSDLMTVIILTNNTNGNSVYVYCYLFVDRITLISLPHVYSLLNRQGEEAFLDFFMLSYTVEHWCVGLLLLCFL